MDLSGGVVWGAFFFQAEDGIRDWSVTGVQTCALPICVELAICMALQMASSTRQTRSRSKIICKAARDVPQLIAKFCARRCLSSAMAFTFRSEERRVGKEGRARWWSANYKRKGEKSERE